MVQRTVCFLGPNQVVDAYFVVKSNVLSLVYPNGEPIDLDGAVTTAAFSPSSNPEQVAKALTKKLRRFVRGERVEGFDRVISYPVDGGVV